MRPNNAWLSVSLFCSKHYWPDLMSKGILPHLNMLYREENLQAHHIHLNYANGENIRLPLLVSYNETTWVARQTDDFFKSYFSKAPVHENKTEVPRNKLFMNFASNTIQYGLYSMKTRHAFYDDTDFQQTLSDIIIEALANDMINDAVILRLSFFLYLTLLQITTQNTNVAFDRLLTIPFYFPYDDRKAPDLGLFAQLFDENKEAMFNISYDITRKSEGLPPWVRQWAAVCKTKMKKSILNNYHKTEGKQAYDEIAYYIDQQVGINESMKFLLFKFIRKVNTV